MKASRETVKDMCRRLLISAENPSNNNILKIFPYKAFARPLRHHSLAPSGASALKTMKPVPWRAVEGFKGNIIWLKRFSNYIWLERLRTKGPSRVREGLSFQGPTARLALWLRDVRLWFAAAN